MAAKVERSQQDPEALFRRQSWLMGIGRGLMILGTDIKNL